MAAACTVIMAGAVIGQVFFNAQVDNTVRVTGQLQLPTGMHGFHIHEFGDLGNDCKAPGGHFGTADQKHGGPTDSYRHFGDLGNIEADENGVANIDFTDNKISLTGASSIIGRAVMIHAGADTLGKSKPSKADAARMACGTIGLAP